MLLIKKPSARDIVLAARKDGFITMQEDGMEKVALGITTEAELRRVLYE